MHYSLSECLGEILGRRVIIATTLEPLTKQLQQAEVAGKAREYIDRYKNYTEFLESYEDYRVKKLITLDFKKEGSRGYDQIISLQKRFNLILLEAGLAGSIDVFFENFEKLLQTVSNYPVKLDYERSYCMHPGLVALQELYRLFLEEDLLPCEAKLEFLARSEFFKKQASEAYLNVVIAAVMRGISLNSLSIERAIGYLQKLVLPILQTDTAIRQEFYLLPKIKTISWEDKRKVIEKNPWAEQFLQFCLQNKTLLPEEWFPLLGNLYCHLIEDIIPQRQRLFNELQRIRSGGSYDEFTFGIGWAERQKGKKSIASPEVVSMVVDLLMIFPYVSLPEILFHPEIEFDIPNYGKYIHQPFFPSFLSRVLGEVEVGAILKKEAKTMLVEILCRVVDLSSYPFTPNAALAIVKLLTTRADYIEKVQPLLEHCSEIIFAAYFRMSLFVAPSEAIKLEHMLEQVYSVHRAILENTIKQLSAKYADLSARIVSLLKTRKPVVDGDFEQLAEFNSLQIECKEVCDLLAKYMHLQIYLSVDVRNIFDSDLSQTDPNIKLWAQRYTRVIDLKAIPIIQDAEPSMTQAIIRFGVIRTQPQEVRVSAAEPVEQEPAVRAITYT